ncbi:unnamed protein product [Cuscuta europaea]|uniref:BED-type domain-containing protein n=1 Tax=Cuscuta europaea TaxID=41803 RepID=A0A9P1EMP7_CUSEU|nr:unnamed protein product [Cuscuta europaea]
MQAPSTNILPFSEGSNSIYIMAEEVDTSINTDQLHVEEIADIPEKNQAGHDGGEEAIIEESALNLNKERAKRSKIWEECFTKIKNDKGVEVKAECSHCKVKLSSQTTGTTTHLTRHMKTCSQSKATMRQQGLLNFQASNQSMPSLAPAIVGGEYDHGKMKEVICHWSMMHEHSFSIAEEEGFNFMMKVANPFYQRIG